jgi:hypothetical protein
MKIWIVQGTTGEYSDRAEWVICAFREEGAAKALADQLNSLARAATTGISHSSRWDETEPGKMLKSCDPQAFIDYTGTDYTAFETELR